MASLFRQRSLASLFDGVSVAATAYSKCMVLKGLSAAFFADGVFDCLLLRYCEYTLDNFGARFGLAAARAGANDAADSIHVPAEAIDRIWGRTRRNGCLEPCSHLPPSYLLLHLFS